MEELHKNLMSMNSRLTFFRTLSPVALSGLVLSALECFFFFADCSTSFE